MKIEWKNAEAGKRFAELVQRGDDMTVAEMGEVLALEGHNVTVEGPVLPPLRVRDVLAAPPAAGFGVACVGLPVLERLLAHAPVNLSALPGCCQRPAQYLAVDPLAHGSTFPGLPWLAAVSVTPLTGCSGCTVSTGVATQSTPGYGLHVGAGNLDWRRAMIRALNALRREMGLPTVPTITGKTRHARALRKQWRVTLAQAAYRPNNTMEHYRDLDACPDTMLGEPNARALGRFVRLAKAVRAGFVMPVDLDIGGPRLGLKGEVL